MMKRCEVLVPFHLKATDTIHVAGDVIVVSEEQLYKIHAINANMVAVLGDVEEQPEQKQKKKGKTASK